VIGDSLAVAYQLISLQKSYPPCLQLALDMLKRLNFSEHIIEILLAKGYVCLDFAFSDQQATKPLRYALKVIAQTQRTGGTEGKIEASRYLDTVLQYGEENASPQLELQCGKGNPLPPNHDRVVFYFLYQFFVSKNFLTESEKEKYKKYLE
jgi:hypothetical protein